MFIRRPDAQVSEGVEMTGFEFVFSLFGLLLGLALAEGLGGLSKAIKASDKVRIGWPTALLGIFVSCDVVTYWMYGWALRDLLEISWPVMFGGFLVTAVYYVSVSLIFPDDPEDWHDLDAHFEKHRRKVLSGILFANISLMATTYALGVFPAFNVRTLIVSWSFFPIIGLSIWTSKRSIAVCCLIWLIFLYPLSAAWA
jgi:hypothetical protein